MQPIVFATTNPGKFSQVKNIFTHHGIDLESPLDFGLQLNVEETGPTLEANARLKAEAFAAQLPPDTIVIGDDTGIEIDALGGEPGIKVRRWNGTHMSDEAIIELCLSKLSGVKPGDRGAQFRTVLAVAKMGDPVHYFEGIMRGEILETPKVERAEGMPFWPIFYLPKLKMTLGEFHAMPMDFQLQNPTHRELAVLQVLPYLAKLSR
jgi:XTP/dITP diphosphohydrolase